MIRPFSFFRLAPAELREPTWRSARSAISARSQGVDPAGLGSFVAAVPFPRFELPHCLSVSPHYAKSRLHLTQIGDQDFAVHPVFTSNGKFDHRE
jgi:hypothetical protein